MERSTSIGGHVVAQLSISFSTKVEIDRTITEPAGRYQNTLMERTSSIGGHIVAQLSVRFSTKAEYGL
ncbi:MAG TPA: hypothetical protein ENG03_08110 [Thioploca sp.]|nr:hypothetical protein [Thioploca sp.]